MRYALLISAALFVAALPLNAQTAAEYPEDSPNWLPMSEAVAAAQSGGDIVLIHSYAPWCGWCQEMDATTYTDDRVQEYLAEHFEVTRLDIESEDRIDFFGGWVPMRELGMALGIRTTPTTVFLDSDGTYLTMAPSYIPAEKFVLILRYVNERAFEMMDFLSYEEMIRASEG